MTTTTRQPEWLAALTALVPDELRDDARDIAQQLRSLYDTALPMCERALTIMEELQARMRRSEEEMVEIVGEDHRDEVHDASWKIMNAISGETHIIEALYAVADILGVAAEAGTLEAFRAKTTPSKQEVAAQ